LIRAFPSSEANCVNGDHGATVIVTGMLLLSEPEVPISSMVVVPVGARREALQVMVTVVLPFAGGVTGLPEAVADTPLGNSLTLKSTAELNPFTLVTVSVVETLPLSSTVNDEGDNDRVKFFVPEEAFTVSATVVL
jgi:sorbitol-specific phosphotransferase system component IIBC